MHRATHEAMPRRQASPGNSRARGVALIAVLSLLSVLTVLALGAMQAARRHDRLARGSFEIAQASELADSAIRVAILELSAPAPTRTIANEPATLSVEVFGQRIEVRLERDVGRIDLNGADDLLLTAAFAGNGMRQGDAHALAQRILDWRDIDDAAGVSGAERQEYARAGRAAGPRNGPFETEAELRQVLGAELITREMMDAFTVYTGRREVLQGVARPPVFRALGWADGIQLGGRRWLSEGSASAESTTAIEMTGEVVRFHACSNAARTPICRVAIVRLTGDRSRPVLIYAWRSQYAGE